MQFSNVVTKLTRTRIVPKVHDLISKAGPVVLRTFGNGKPWSSGTQLELVFKHKDANQGGTTGIASKLNTSRVNTRDRLVFDPKAISHPVVVADIEKELNKGDERVIELLAAEYDSVADEARQDLASEMWSGTGSGNSWDSFDNASDDSTNYSTYGTKSRSTFTVLKGDLTTSVGTLALSDLSSVYDNTSSGMDSTTVFATDTTGWTAYEGLLQPSVAMNIQASGYPQVTRTGSVPSQRALGGDLGFDSIFFRGKPIVRDDTVPSGEMHAINEKAFDFYGINMSGDRYEKLRFKGTHEGGGQGPTPRGFNVTKLMAPTDQLAQVAHVYIAGNFASGRPNTQGRLEGITG